MARAVVAACSSSFCASSGGVVLEAEKLIRLKGYDVELLPLKQAVQA